MSVTWLAEISERLRLSPVTTGVEARSLGEQKGCWIGNWRAGRYVELPQPLVSGGEFSEDAWEGEKEREREKTDRRTRQQRRYGLRGGCR